MSRIFVKGFGAVSPAGWGVPALREALARGVPLPQQPLTRPGWEKPLQIRAIPAPAAKLDFLAHARLRRASPMTHYTVGAALEAMAPDIPQIQSGAIRLGIIACTMTGGISYSRRFYQEVMQDPATASPLVFPETVFNAPTSHLAAYLGTKTVNYSLVGDPGAFLQGLALAAQWLEENVADACAVIGAEEVDWTAGDALRLFQRRAVHTAGAGVLYLKMDSAEGGVELTAVTDPVSTQRELRAQLPTASATDLLCESEGRLAGWDDWPGARLAPGDILGEGFAAGAAWQCVAACDAVQRCQYPAADVIVGGMGWQSIGARFVNTKLTNAK